MSIVCYTGLPGEGKSYSAVANFVIPALKDKRAVATNLLLNVAALSVVVGFDVSNLVHMFPKDCTPDELIAHCPPGAVVVIDEVWNYWAAGTAVNEVPKSQVSFFKEHRHRVGDDGLSTEICIIDQDPKTGIPAFLRALVELTYLHSKHSKLGAKGRFRVDVYSRCQSAEKPSKGALIRKLQGRYEPTVWNCYVSHTQAKRIGEAGLEKMVDDRANLWKGWTLRSAMVGAVAVPFLIWFAVSSVLGMVKGGGLKESAKAARAVPTAPTQAIKRTPTSANPAQQPISVNTPAVAVAPPAPVIPPASNNDPSQIWRILGVVANPDGTGIALVASATGRRRVSLKEHCRYDAASVDWECTVDGHKVTYWTGTRLGGDYNAALVPGAATGTNMPKG